MKTYELTYIISSQISAEEAESLAKETETFIQGKEGVILKSDKPVAKTLSYPMKGQASGFFTISEFQVPPEKIGEIKERLEKDAKILRNFIVVKEPVKIQKQRRTKRIFPTPEFETKTERAYTKSEEPSPVESLGEVKTKKADEKADLNDIEKKLDEILGE